MGRHSPLLRDIRHIGWFAVKFAGIVHCITEYGYSVVKCRGTSMDPSLQHNSYILVDKWSHRFESPRVGDVVVCGNPKNPKSRIVKRIFSGGGAVIRMHATIDGIPDRHITVPRDYFWIMGDNVPSSRDSRHYGPIPYNLICGTVIMTLWPRFQWGVPRRQRTE